MTEKRRVLEDHQRSGKVLRAPVNQILNLSDVSWPDELLPDVLWLDLVLQEIDPKEAVSVAEKIGVSGDGLTNWLCLTSSFGAISPDEATRVVQSLESAAVLGTIREAARPLVASYRGCGLEVLFDSPPPSADGDLDRIRDSISSILNRWGERATRAQSLAAMIGIFQGKLHFRGDSSLVHLDKVWSEPESEDALRAGSAARTTVSMLLNHSADAMRQWCQHFWEQGHQLAECDVLDGDE